MTFSYNYVNMDEHGKFHKKCKHVLPLTTKASFVRYFLNILPPRFYFQIKQKMLMFKYKKVNF